MYMLPIYCALINRRVYNAGMVPAKFFLAREDLPSTGTGKLDRRTLSEWAVPEEGVGEDDEGVWNVWEQVEGVCVCVCVYMYACVFERMIKA